MNRKIALVLAAAVAAGAVTAGFAVAGSAGDESPLTGSALERATVAALAHTGGGAVIETETGDDGAAYGVEIRLDDGTEVEVELDENFDVIGQEVDDDGGGNEEGPDED